MVKKTQTKKATKNRYEKVESTSESDGDFDARDPFKDDDIEIMNKNNDKMIFNNIKSKEDDVSDEEVLAFDDDDDSDDSEYEDKNAETDDDNIDDEAETENNEFEMKSWGNKKSAYYSGNRIRNEEDADLEEEEAKLMQSKLMQQLDLNDFDLESFKFVKRSDPDAQQSNTDFEKITKNFDKMTKSEKFECLKEESPELLDLINEFKAQVKSLQELYIPIFKLIKNKDLEHTDASDYVMNKLRLNLMYCCHLCLYLVLKAQKLPIDNHPVINNILKLRHVIGGMDEIDTKLNEEIKKILNLAKSGGKIEFIKLKKDVSKSKKMNSKLTDNNFENYLERMNTDNLSSVEEEVEPSVNKRAINYQIEKNKGLTPKRNKLYRNPRVRHKEKYRKALIKRKSVIPQMRSTMKRYSGETTGIRSNVVKAIKLK